MPKDKYNLRIIPIFVPEMKVWTDLSSLQPRKKMLNHVLLTPFRQCFRSSLPPLFIFPILIFNL
ncbi:hypothetical protein GAO02_10585 [Bacteroides thetaiotaomicron]|nr:hypothetical protein GAO02_10585 [Bacteroides thetaiotaomicron]